MAKESRERAHGPYPHGRRWRVVLVAANGARRHRSFAEEREGRDYVDAFNDETDTRTLSTTITAFVQHLRDSGRAASTVRTTEHRLVAILGVVDRDRSLRSLTESVAKRLARSRAQETATDTQVGELAAARQFGEWCVEQGWLADDPFAEIEPTGQRARGKEQLRIDEARTFSSYAINEGTPASIGAVMPLLMNMRASEITNRSVRDIDDGARVLWITRAKTRAGDRSLEVPEVLRPFLSSFTAGRSGGDRLFGDVDRHWVRYHVHRICRATGVTLVCPHGLRGTWASLATPTTPVDQVARALGHTNATITRRHYLADGVEQASQQRNVLTVLQGGAA